MKTFYIFIIHVLTFSPGICQMRYAKIIDFDNRPQGAEEIIKYKDNYFIHQTGICIDEDGNLLEACSGLLLMDGKANILDSILVRRFSTGVESMVMDSAHNQIYFVGEEYFKDDYPNAFMVNLININALTLADSYMLHDGGLEKRKYFQLVSTLFNQKLMVGGSTNELNNQSTEGLIFIIDQNKIDTFLTINYAAGNTVWSSFVDINNQLTLSILVRENALNEKAHIVKYDQNLNLVWHWISEPTRSTQSTQMCELANGNIVIALADKTFNNAVKLVCIREDKSIAWEFKFWDHNTKTARDVYSLKKLKNGDFIGTGTYGNTNINMSTRILRVPYVFRMSADGKLLWEKAFYRDRRVLDFCEGSLHDVEETENGDIIAVGNLRNYLEYDPIVMQGRSDPDIFIVRMDANGCIDDKCEMLTKVFPDTLSSAINTSHFFEEAMIYPNPSNGHIELLNNEAVSRLYFYTAQGVLAKEVATPDQDLFLTDLPSGMYIIHLQLKSGKIIKQKIIIY
ncbi:MAG TPA: T9SS type A sorting domain-containing protein [Saprospiraceae bacterium]|nr:T9SS type A sorting domain-containing protein [Saprospiraceae bacterium]